MLDQCSIFLRHEVPVNPDIFTNPRFLIHDFLHFSIASPRSKRRRVGEETETQTSGYFEIYADRSLAVHTRQSELGGSTHQVISRIDLNFGKILRGHNGRPHTSNLDHKQRLLSFNLDHLKAAHRHYFSDLKGIYHAAKDASDRSTAGFGVTLAAISMRWQLPVREILDLYRLTSGKAPGSIESTCREMRKQIERFLAESSIVTAEELLSDEAYRTQPPVDVKGLAGHAASYATHFALDLDLDIWKAYSSKRSGCKLDPDTSSAWQ